MLYLTRRVGEAVIVNNSIEVRVVELKGKTVKLGFNFPSSASVLREEIHKQISQANEDAAATASALSQNSALNKANQRDQIVDDT